MASDPDPYLLGLVLEGRPVVVAGGGAVTERRVERLVAAGARIRVVAPEIGAGLRGRAEAGELVWLPRRWAPGDLGDAWFALAATDDPDTNAAVAAEAEAHRVFCVRADEAGGGSARTPATVVEDGVLVGVLTGRTTGHGDPGRIRRVRDGLGHALRDLLAEES